MILLVAASCFVAGSIFGALILGMFAQARIHEAYADGRIDEHEDSLRDVVGMAEAITREAVGQ